MGLTRSAASISHSQHDVMHEARVHVQTEQRHVPQAQGTCPSVPCEGCQGFSQQLPWNLGYTVQWYSVFSG